jgi:hypothetical protein
LGPEFTRARYSSRTRIYRRKDTVRYGRIQRLPGFLHSRASVLREREAFEIAVSISNLLRSLGM